MSTITSAVLSAWIVAVGLHEGRGKLNHAAYNSAEDARGAWQIRPIMVREVARLTGQHFDHSRMHEAGYAYAFVEAYFRERLARGDTLKTIARRWNGSGPQAQRYAGAVERIARRIIKKGAQA